MKKGKLYKVAIVGCIVIIVGALYIIFKPEKKVTPSGIEVVSMTWNNGSKEIEEAAAKDMAQKQFRILGESVNKEELNVTKFQRKGEEYYYVTSLQNSVEIKVKGGNITKINAASVEE